MIRLAMSWGRQGAVQYGSAMARRTLVFIAAMALLALVVALPAIAAPPAGAGKDKVPSTPITISGTVVSSTDENGKTTYTLTDGGTTYTLHAGPPWFFGHAYPLESYVGHDVVIDGEVAEGSTDVEVRTVDGTALRAPGKPPWAGGWKAVGEIHPGWSQDKADKFATMAERFGGCFPPGQCKDKSKGADPDGDEPAD